MDENNIPIHKVNGPVNCAYTNCSKGLPNGSYAFLTDDANKTLYCSDLHAMEDTGVGELMSGYIVRLEYKPCQAHDSSPATAGSPSE